MKPSSVLLASFVGLVFFVLLPFASIKINDFFVLPVISYPVFKAFGLILFLAGVLLIIYSTKLFFILGKGTPVPIEPPKKLVVNGVYKYSRNPIYLSYFLIFLGYFFFFGHLTLLVYFIIFVTGTNLLVAFYEEPILKKRFGKVYEDYLQKTSRWF